MKKTSRWDKTLYYCGWKNTFFGLIVMPSISMFVQYFSSPFFSPNLVQKTTWEFCRHPYCHYSPSRCQVTAAHNSLFARYCFYIEAFVGEQLLVISFSLIPFISTPFLVVAFDLCIVRQAVQSCLVGKRKNIWSFYVFCTVQNINIYIYIYIYIIQYKTLVYII
jgi:hypothetical protein